MFNPADKQTNIDLMNQYMLTKTLSMFEYSNLPDTLPQRELEKLLQMQGYAFITEVEGEIYAFNGGLGGVQDMYYRPTEIVISNPYLKFNETLNIENDGVLFSNDDLRVGLWPYYNKVNYQLDENDINMSIWGYI